MQLEDYFDFLAPDDIRLKGHRIGIESVLYAYIHQHKTPEEIAQYYTTLCHWRKCTRRFCTTSTGTRRRSANTSPTGWSIAINHALEDLHAARMRDSELRLLARLAEEKKAREQERA